MHHFPPFQPNPKGMSTTSISVGALDTPPPSPPYQLPSPSSHLDWRAGAGTSTRDPPPRPRRRETPAEKDPCFALTVLRAPRHRDSAYWPGNEAVVPTLAEIEKEVRSYRCEAAAQRPQLRPAKRTRYQAPVDALSLPLPSPPPSPPPSSSAFCHVARPQGESAPRLRPALRTPSASSSRSLSSSSSKPRKTVRFAATAPETQFFASWDAPSSLKLLCRTPGRAVPELAGGSGAWFRGGDDPLPPSPPPAWHWQLRTPDLQAAPSSSSTSSPPVVQLRDLFLGARRPPSVVLGLVSVARGGNTPTTPTVSGRRQRRRATAPPGTVVCEGTRDGGRTWGAARAGAGWFCAAPRCDWFQFALDTTSLGLLGNDDGDAADGQEKEAAAATATSSPNSNKKNKNTLALRVRYQDEDGRQWVDDNHGAGFEVRFELCWAGDAANPIDDDDDDDDEGSTSEELGWNE